MITRRINEWARRQPDRPAVLEGESSISYFEFARKIEAARRHFAAFNLPREHFAFVFGATQIEHWVMALALRSLGLNTVGAPTLDAAIKLKLGNVACVAVSEHVILGPSRTLPAALKGARLIPVSESVYARERVPGLPAGPGDNGASGGYVLYTSGTTGTYKKLLGGGPTEEGVIAWNLKTATFDRHTVYHMLNFPAWTGIGATAATVWHAGGCLAYLGPSNDFGAFYRHKPTRAPLVPFHLPKLLEARPPGEPPLAELELSVTGGFLPARLAGRVREELTPNIEINFGSTEVCAFMRARFETADDLEWLSAVGQIDVVDPHGAICAPGTEGELRVRLMEFDTASYMDDSETTAKYFRDGFFYPGDAAVSRADGRIRVLGRIDDVVNIDGIKIAAAPIEERIQKALGVDCACVFSGRNSAGEEDIRIAVESESRPAVDVLARAVKGIRGFDRARWVFLESFPRTEAGLAKIDRRKLRRMLA